MSTEIEKKENRLPTIAEIYKEDNLLDAKQTSQLLLLLNCNPPASWVLEHPIHKTPYIPVEKIEFLLTKIFGEWRLEIKSYQLIANSVAVCIRLYYTNPVTGKEMYQDGIGASTLQTDKGAGATDFNAIKSTAVSMALPAAESYALKDAAEKIGKLFGKDIARKSTMDYESMLLKSIDTIEDVRKKTFEDD